MYHSQKNFLIHLHNSLRSRLHSLFSTSPIDFRTPSTTSLHARHAETRYTRTVRSYASSQAAAYKKDLALAGADRTRQILYYTIAEVALGGGARADWTTTGAR